MGGLYYRSKGFQVQNEISQYYEILYEAGVNKYFRLRCFLKFLTEQ